MNTEQRYAQIEKEALPIIWACDNFSTFIIEKNFEIETDHKLLVFLLSSKHLHVDTLPPRILRFRLRLGRYDYSILMYQESFCLPLMHYQEHLAAVLLNQKLA